MSLERSATRLRKLAAARPKEDTPPPPAVAYSIQEFCAAHRVSRSWLYLQWKAGRGPRFMRAGVKRIITSEAAADWRREGVEAATAPKQPGEG
jgi:hypothetical protein